MTVLCVWLGYKFARERRAAEMDARHNALLDQIIINTVPPPTGTFHTLNPGSRDVLSAHLGRTTSRNRLRRDAILRAGAADTVTTESLVLDVSGLTAKYNKPDIARQLATHYSDGFENLGLNPRITTNRPANASGFRATIVWTSPKNELIVIVDANVSADQPTAEVEMLLIDSQQLRLW